MFFVFRSRLSRMNDVSHVLRKRSPISNRRKSRLSTRKSNKRTTVDSFVVDSLFTTSLGSYSAEQILPLEINFNGTGIDDLQPCIEDIRHEIERLRHEEQLLRQGFARSNYVR
jgi:hypothetical protein